MKKQSTGGLFESIWTLCRQVAKLAFVTTAGFVFNSNLMAVSFSDLNFEAASRQAAQTGKIVLVDFYTTWCGPCKMLDKNTWTDEAVTRLLAQKTVALRIDAEKETVLAKRYKIEAYPSVVLIKPDGTEIDRLVGYREPRAFIAEFNDALAGKDSISRAREKMMDGGTNDPIARMQFGVALAQKGRDADALAEYLWCFDHGLEGPQGPAFTGVRSSFLLMYIKNLGAKYPPAQKALEDLRDDRQAKFAAGKTDLQTVQDLVSLNGVLDQKEKNLAVFDHLPAGNGGRDLILSLFATEFLEARRYEDYLHGTDGKAGFKKAMDQFNFTLDSVGKDNPMKSRMEESLRTMTVNAGANGFEALAGLKRTQDGKDLAGQILKFDSSQATHDLLAAAAQRAGNTELAQFVKQ